MKLNIIMRIKSRRQELNIMDWRLWNSAKVQRSELSIGTRDQSSCLVVGTSQVSLRIAVRPIHSFFFQAIKWTY